MAAAKERAIPSPPTNPETQACWDAASQGKLLLKRCVACGEPLFDKRTQLPARAAGQETLDVGSPIGRPRPIRRIPASQARTVPRVLRQRLRRVFKGQIGLWSFRHARKQLSNQ